MKRFVSYFVVFILGFVVCAWTINKFYGPPMGLSKILTAPNAPRIAPAVIEAGNNQISSAATLVSDYVVNIDTVGRTITRFDPLADLFGGESVQRYAPRGQGSGVVFSPDGYIVTNHHVAAGAAELRVTLHNGKQYRGKIVGTDPSTDIAVIKIDAKNLKAARFANSDTLRVGDWVMAVGSPLGYESTVTVGVVSAMRRGPFAVQDRVLQLEKMIQTDAAINPGNSGGALSDLNGNLIGINTIIASNSGGSIGIGFAIPSNTAKSVAEQLISKGRVDHPYLGISYTPYDEDRRTALERGGVMRLPKEQGAEIRRVYPSSPADQAGLQPGDIVLKINGKDVSVMRSVERGKVSISEAVSSVKIGETITMQVWRYGNARLENVTVRVGRMPQNFGQEQP